jgi:hypothetical protein
MHAILPGKAAWLWFLASMLPFAHSSRLIHIVSQQRSPPMNSWQDAVLVAQPFDKASMSTSMGSFGVTERELIHQVVGNKTDEGKQILPLIWLHTPKTGSSFATTLAHFGCPSIPENVIVKEVSWQNPFNNSKFERPFDQQFPLSQWCNGSFQHFVSGHSPVWGQYQHVVSMFRNPKKRMLSGYFHNFHDCPSLRERYGCANENNNCMYMYSKPFWLLKSRIRKYSECTSGCQVHMLTGNECGVMGSQIKNQVNETDALSNALSAIDTLGFVGLTEEWPLSVCLFHVRFGGSCYKASFINVRPGKSIHRYDTILGKIGSWNIGPDEVLYNATVDRFWKDIKTYGVTRAKCREQICPEAASFFQDEVQFDILEDDEF